MEQICEDAHFSCGNKLFNDADPQYEHLKQFNFGMDRRKVCDDPLEPTFFSRDLWIMKGKAVIEITLSFHKTRTKKFLLCYSMGCLNC